MHAAILLAVAATCSAMPSFIAVPADQIAFVDLSALRVRRVPRQTLTPPPPPQLQQLPQQLQQLPQQLPQALYKEEYAPVQYQHQQLALVQEPEAPVRIVQEAPDAASSASQFAERPPDFGEYVDFGAHTGDNGAFGWYADYPVNNHDDSSYRK